MGRRALWFAAWAWLLLVGCQEGTNAPGLAAASVAASGSESAVIPATVAPSTTATAATSGSVEPANPPRPPKNQGNLAQSTPDSGAKTAKKDRAAALERIKTCCTALTKETKKGGPKAKRYEIAAAICHQISERVKSGQAKESAAKTLIRSQILGLKVPGGC